MRREAATRIVATLGPSSSTKEIVTGLLNAGATVFRMNFSHGEHADHAARYHMIRAIEQEVGRPIGVLGDLQGPKLRIGRFAHGRIDLKPGQHLRLDLEDVPGDERRVTLPHREIFAVLEPGHHLLLDDGKIRLLVTEANPSWAEAEVIAGGPLSDRKGVNVPHAVLPLAALTEKDRRDLAFALELGVDWVALSFVQRGDDIAEAKKLVQGRAGVMAKLEKPAAIEHLEEIIELADAVMVARGDLGVELPAEDVPPLQRRIVRASRSAGKPVIVATQMLESMITAPTPTRAEASDVATAVYEGVDAVMLSAETASGQYPVEAVAMMDRIIRRVERDEFYRATVLDQRMAHEKTSSDALAAAAAQVAETIDAAAIVSYTTSGLTALRVARERPSVPIIGLTSKLSTARRLTLTWGVFAATAPDCRSFDEMVAIACETALNTGFAELREKIAITAGVPFGTPGATNVLRVAIVGGELPVR
jgi:pyruvate kinase